MTHLQKLADGHLVNVKARNCTACDIDYLEFEAALSGITLCNNVCFNDPADDSAKPAGMPNPNGIYVLTQHDTEACSWLYVESGTFGTITYYSNEDDCTGANTVFDLDTLTISLSKFAGTRWSILVRYQDSSDPSNYYAQLYRSSLPVVDDGDCSSVTFVGPDYTDCDPTCCNTLSGTRARIANAGYGGSVTITPLARGHLAKCP